MSRQQSRRFHFRNSAVHFPCFSDVVEPTRKFTAVPLTLTLTLPFPLTLSLSLWLSFTLEAL